ASSLPSWSCWQELLGLTPTELVSLEVPQKLLREAGGPLLSPMPHELAQLLLQVVEEEESFPVHVYRERQDVSLRVLTEPFWLFCCKASAAALKNAGEAEPQRPYVVQAEPLVTMGNLDRLLLITGGFLGSSEDYLRSCLRLIGRKLYRGADEYYVEGVVVLAHVALPVHLLQGPKGVVVPCVLALGDWRMDEASASRGLPEQNEDVPGIVGDYSLAAGVVVEDTAPQPLDPEQEELYMELLRLEAKASGIREGIAELCQRRCVAVCASEENEIVDAIAQSVEGLLIPQEAAPLLKRFGWLLQAQDEQDDSTCDLWDPPAEVPVLPGFFQLKIQPPPPDPPGPGDPVWAVIISFDAGLPFELVWPSVEVEVKNAFTSVSNKWSEIGWPGGEQEMMAIVRQNVSEAGEAAVARGLTHSSASRIFDRLAACVACRVVSEADMPPQIQAGGTSGGQRGKAATPKATLRDLVEVKVEGAWAPAVLVASAGPLYVSLASGALATGKHRVFPVFDGPRLYPVPPAEAQVQTRADLQSLERGAESSRITKRFSPDCGLVTAPSSPLVQRGRPLPKPTMAYSLGGSSGSDATVSLLRGKDVKVQGRSWVSDSWTTVGLPELSSRGKVYYELHIDSHDTPQIGWASEKFRFFCDTWLYGVGDDLESWGADGARMRIWHGGEAGSFPEHWPSEVVVGCAADVAAGTIQFSTNGVWSSSPTFTGVRCASLYPAVSGQMTAAFKISPEEWLHGPPDDSYAPLSASARTPKPLPAPVRFPADWVLAKGLQHLAERQQVDLLTTLRLSCEAVLPSLTSAESSCLAMAGPQVEDATDEHFDFVLDIEGQPRSGEAWVDETLGA
ncbi:unnamed protein product, partial [Polarella glacialis]